MLLEADERQEPRTTPLEIDDRIRVDAMKPPLGGFDFGLLSDPEFREDSVREEVVVPLLSALGYSAKAPHRIIRSRRLEHPFVYIGTAKKNIVVVPDYLLQRDGANAWVLDAKAPGETIDAGPHVEQAYSYAIHRDIRVPVYGLCNGRRLVVFHIHRGPPVLDVELSELAEHWPRVLAMLGTAAAWPGNLLPGFHADFGLALQKAGLVRDGDGKKIYQIFVSFPIHSLARLEDGLYCASGLYGPGAVLVDMAAGAEPQGWGSALMATFDFGPDVYKKLLAALPDDLSARVRTALSRQPYQILFDREEVPPLTVVADPGDTVHQNANESYCPFQAEEFVREPKQW